ncbi:MAG: sensor histidine kinase [Deltaproteobacteria bacterium]
MNAGANVVVAGRLLARFRAGMRPLALGAGLAVALSAPFADLLLERHDLEQRARRHAVAVARRLGEAPSSALPQALAAFEDGRAPSGEGEETLAVELSFPETAPVRWSGGERSWPTVTGEVPLALAGRTGTVRVTVGEREWLWRDGLLLGAFSLLGLVLGAALYVFPLRLFREEELVRALVGRSLCAEEDERLRLSRELHDGLGQTASALAVAIARAQAVAPSAPLAEASALADLALEEIRRTARALRPPALDDLGLGPAVSALARRLADEAGVALDLRVEEIPRLSPELELCCYRLSQEGLANVVRHAGARRIEVGLACAGPALTLRIADDGRGFSPSGPLGLGLLGARERVAALRGSLRVETAPGAGTRLFVTLPLSPAEAAEPA